MLKLKSKILILAALIFAIGDLFAITAIPRAAQASILGVEPWYGGVIIDNLPPTLVCPHIIQVFDFSSDSVVSLFVAPFSEIFPNFDLVVPGTFV